MLTQKTISILGCGWLGLALAKSLISKKNIVKGSCTTETKMELLTGMGIDPYLLKFTGTGKVIQSDFFNCDVLVVRIPPLRKSGESALYPEKIKEIQSSILYANTPKVIYISSTGVYADNNVEVTEADSPKPDTESGKVLLEAEQIIQRNKSYKSSVVRFGGLIGADRDAGRFFAGKIDVPNGLAPVNLILQKDCVEIIERIIERDAYNFIFNACSASHPPKMEFYMRAAESSGLQIPQFIKELKQWKIVRSKNLKEILDFTPSNLP